MQEKARKAGVVSQYTEVYCDCGAKARLDCIAIQCPAKPRNGHGGVQTRGSRRRARGSRRRARGRSGTYLDYDEYCYLAQVAVLLMYLDFMMLGQVMYLGRALRSNETLPDFRECRVGYLISTSIPRVDG